MHKLLTVVDVYKESPFATARRGALSRYYGVSALGECRTEQDRAAFKERADMIVAQFERYEPVLDIKAR